MIDEEAMVDHIVELKRALTYCIGIIDGLLAEKGHNIHGRNLPDWVFEAFDASEPDNLPPMSSE